MFDSLYLRDGGNRAFEILQTDATLGGQFDAKKHGYRESKRLCVQFKALPAKDTCLFQPFETAPRGRLAEA